MAAIRRFHLDMVGLGALAVLAEGQAHPYEIQRLIRERHKDFALAPPRALYHAITRLEERGLVEAVETNRDGRRPERTVYAITDHGCEEVASWVADLLETPAPGHPLFSAAMSLVGVLTVARVAEALRVRILRLEGSLAAGRATQRMLLDDLRLARVVLLENELTMRLAECEVAWCREILDDLDNGRLQWETCLPGTEMATTKRGQHS